MKKLIALLAMLAMLGVPAAASAQGVGYGSPGGSVQATLDDAGDGSPPPSQPRAADTSSSPNSTPAAAANVQAPAQDEGTLPFTGLEVGLVAIAGLALVATGIGLRRIGTFDSSAS